MPWRLWPRDRIWDCNRSKIEPGYAPALCEGRKRARTLVDISISEAGVDESSLATTLCLELAGPPASRDRARVADGACHRSLPITRRGKKLRESDSRDRVGSHRRTQIRCSLPNATNPLADTSRHGSVYV